MRKAFGLFLLLTVAACSSGGDSAGGGGGGGGEIGNASAEQAVDMDASAASDSPQPPAVSPTAAPGVAFDYRYSFRLPAQRVGPVQEKHAAACEKLGPERCRITGMTYAQDGEEGVSAQLALKLDPALARRFGREASDLVSGSEGLVAGVEITGEDVGSRIERGQEDQSELRESLARTEAQLGQKGRSGGERAELQRQAEELRAMLRSGERAIGEHRRLLATTPMVFNYVAGETDRSFRGELAGAFEGFLDGARMLIILFIYLLPWLLVALAALLGWKWVNRRFLGGSRLAAEGGAGATAA